MMMIEKATKVYPLIRLYRQECLGTFTDLTLFALGYFSTQGRGEGSRTYIYLTLFTFRLCMGIQWW